MKTLIAIVLGTVLALGLAATPAHAAPARSAPGPELTIVKIGYNAAGPDTTTNRWQEYVDLTNSSGRLLNIKNWSLQDAWAHTTHGNNPQPGDCNTAIFTKESLPWLDTDADDDGAEDGLWLPKGHHIRVYTGGAADNSDNTWHTMAINRADCGYNGHYWNNLKDTARLKKPGGVLVDTYSYDFKQGYWIAAPRS